MKKNICILIMLLIPYVLFSLGQGEKTPTSFSIGGLQGPTSIGLMDLFQADYEQYELSILNTPDLMIARLVSGELDMAAVPINVAAILHARNLPYSVVAITGSGLLYGVTLNDDIQSFSDLHKTTVHCVGKGSTPEFIVKYLSQEYKIQPKWDFSLNQLEIIPQMLSSRIDTAILPEPFLSILLQRIPHARIFVDLQEEWFALHETNYPMSAFIVSNDLLEDNKEAVLEFLALYRDSIEWVNANPFEAAGLVETHMGLPAMAVEQAIPRLNLHYTTTKEARASIEKFLDILFHLEPRSIGGQLPDSSFYYD